MTKRKPNSPLLLGASVLMIAGPLQVYGIFKLVESLGLGIFQDRPWAILILALVITALVVFLVMRLLQVERTPPKVTIVHSERKPVESALHRATPEEIVALTELAWWMKKHQMVLVTGRANGIRIGASQDVIRFMEKHLDPYSAGAVAGNLVPIPN